MDDRVEVSSSSEDSMSETETVKWISESEDEDEHEPEVNSTRNEIWRCKYCEICKRCGIIDRLVKSRVSTTEEWIRQKKEYVVICCNQNMQIRLLKRINDWYFTFDVPFWWIRQKSRNWKLLM